MPQCATIALVDDCELIHITLAAVLEDAGFLVHCYRCPTELLQSDALHHIDCILTDLDMPVMNGCELQLHVLSRKLQLPIVFMTGSTDERPKLNALRRGAFAYLSKPTRIGALLEILSSAVASHGMIRGVFPAGLAVA